MQDTIYLNDPTRNSPVASNVTALTLNDPTTTQGGGGEPPATSVYFPYVWGGYYPTS